MERNQIRNIFDSYSKDNTLDYADFEKAALSLEFAIRSEINGILKDFKNDTFFENVLFFIQYWESVDAPNFIETMEQNMKNKMKTFPEHILEGIKG